MLGSAYQAKYGLVHSNTSFADMTQHLPPPTLACEPSKDADEVLWVTCSFTTGCRLQYS